MPHGTQTMGDDHDDRQPVRGLDGVDDLIATGGTAAATAQMVRQLGGEVVALAFIVSTVVLAKVIRSAGRNGDHVSES